MQSVTGRGAKSQQIYIQNILLSQQLSTFYRIYIDLTINQYVIK